MGGVGFFNSQKQLSVTTDSHMTIKIKKSECQSQIQILSQQFNAQAHFVLCFNRGNACIWLLSNNYIHIYEYIHTCVFLDRRLQRSLYTIFFFIFLLFYSPYHCSFFIPLIFVADFKKGGGCLFDWMFLYYSSFICSCKYTKYCTRIK